MSRPDKAPDKASLEASDMRRTETADLLHGVKAIGEYLGMTRAAAQHRIDSGIIPHFRMGGSIVARRSSLDAWIAEREAASRAPAPNP